jgi:8-oxo-dGTP pyrophosphatase MutT (NUDIX family)
MTPLKSIGKEIKHAEEAVQQERLNASQPPDTGAGSVWTEGTPKINEQQHARRNARHAEGAKKIAAAEQHVTDLRGENGAQAQQAALVKTRESMAQEAARPTAKKELTKLQGKGLADLLATEVPANMNVMETQKYRAIAHRMIGKAMANTSLEDARTLVGKDPEGMAQALGNSMEIPELRATLRKWTGKPVPAHATMTELTRQAMGLLKGAGPAATQTESPRPRTKKAKDSAPDDADPPAARLSAMDVLAGDDASSQVIKAAGVLFLTPDNRVLLLKRAKGEGDHADEWALPGGKLDEGEDAEGAARRECWEEIRVHPQALHEFAQREAHGVDYTTFLARTPEFDVTLNPEHSAQKWASLEDAFKMKLHPGVAAILKALPKGQPKAERP